MRLRRICTLALTAGLALALAGPALAERRWVVSGTLDSAADDGRSIEVDERTYTITPTTTIRDGEGERKTWADVGDREEQHVDLLVVRGHPHPIVRSLILADEVEDPSE